MISADKQTLMNWLRLLPSVSDEMLLDVVDTFLTVSFLF